MSKNVILSANALDPSLLAIPTNDPLPLTLLIFTKEFSPTLIPLSFTFLKFIKDISEFEPEKSIASLPILKN